MFCPVCPTNSVAAEAFYCTPDFRSYAFCCKVWLAEDMLLVTLFYKSDVDYYAYA